MFNKIKYILFKSFIIFSVNILILLKIITFQNISDTINNIDRFSFNINCLILYSIILCDFILIIFLRTYNLNKFNFFKLIYLITFIIISLLLIIQSYDITNILLNNNNYCVNKSSFLYFTKNNTINNCIINYKNVLDLFISICLIYVININFLKIIK